VGYFVLSSIVPFLSRRQSSFGAIECDIPSLVIVALLTRVCCFFCLVLQSFTVFALTWTSSHRREDQDGG